MTNLIKNSIRSRAIGGLTSGDTFTLKRTFTKEETLGFGDMTKDYNPVHYDRRWTDAKGIKGLICHGLLVGSMVCEFGGQVGWLATGMDFKFIKPVYFDDTILCTVTMTDVEDNGRAKAKATFTNQEGQQVALATLSGRLPGNPEKEILRAMIREGDPTNPLSDKQYATP